MYVLKYWRDKYTKFWNNRLNSFRLKFIAYLFRQVLHVRLFYYGRNTLSISFFRSFFGPPNIWSKFETREIRYFVVFQSDSNISPLRACRYVFKTRSFRRKQTTTRHRCHFRTELFFRPRSGRQKTKNGRKRNIPKKGPPPCRGRTRHYHRRFERAPIIELLYVVGAFSSARRLTDHRCYFRRCCPGALATSWYCCSSAGPERTNAHFATVTTYIETTTTA